MAVTINPLKISGGRKRLSTFSLFNRAAPQQQGGDDPGTRLALQQNQAALNTINASLITVTQQITLLSASLTNISKEVKQSAALERIKSAQDAKQQRMLAERKLRDEKELLFDIPKLNKINLNKIEFINTVKKEEFESWVKKIKKYI